MALTSNLPEFIYQGKDIPDILRLYENSLREEGTFKSLAHAAAIKNYHDLIVDKKFLASLRKTFDTLYQVLEKNIPNLLFSIDGRRKSLLSTEDKIVQLLSKNMSLDLFRDMFAFRIVIFGSEAANSMKLINKCYSVMNYIINFYVEAGLILCESDPVRDTMDKNSDDAKKIIIPEKSGISPFYTYGVKDYILHPKENGYQSLHCVFRTKTGYTFEIQVRTFGMHVYAVDGRAQHSSYKKKKYETALEIDKTKVHIPGYELSDTNKLFDFIGLEEPLSIFHRQKTFI